MTARDFARLRTVFEEAVTLPAGEQRRRFLKGACAGDPVTLAGVEQLLVRDSELAARELGSLPRFGAYRATRQLGPGGMGVVYDTKPTATANSSASSSGADYVSTPTTRSSFAAGSASPFPRNVHPGPPTAVPRPSEKARSRARAELCS